MTSVNDVAVEVVDLTKHYGSFAAVRSINLRVANGQYFVLLGPSGGGKTTLLRLVGGFLRPTSGKVLLHGQDVSDLPPNKRPTSMVFQSYALFPHMNVERNVGYGLRLQGLNAGSLRERVNNMLELVGLADLNKRMPHELSGGQQQRVQLARSLVLDRDILLLDEPLASLDAKLRKDMCLELKHIQEKVGITFLHVTHNQEEAMTVADHIAIVADGRLVESATPKDIYRNPRARFTAEFIGENNVLHGRVVASDSVHIQIDLGHATVQVANAGDPVEHGTGISFSIPSEKLRLAEVGGDGMERLPATFVERLFLGLTINDVVRLADGTDIVVRSLASDAAPDPVQGEEVTVAWKCDDARLHMY
jgi:ABC-type Fe3+/spermidine/putrescine transport system ATPase subunit